MDRGILVVLSGFSGAGKGTIVGQLLERYKERYALSVSATTRAPREGEKEGVSYFFVTKERFEQMIAENALIEHACYVGNYYGTPRAYVEEQMAAGRSVILEIEMQGALQIRKLFPDTRLIFITTPSAQILKERLIGRGTESEEVIAERLGHAREEAEYIPKYDYLIVNDDLESAVEQVHAVISAECAGEPERAAEHLVMRNQELVARITEELSAFSKGE